MSTCVDTDLVGGEASTKDIRETLGMLPHILVG